MIKENVVLDVDTEKSSSLEVLFQDEIRLEFNVPLIYVKSGEEDIKQYVENVVKPDFAVYVNDRKAAIAAAAEAGVDDIAAAEKSAENDLDAFLQEEIKTELNNYVDTTVKSSLEDYGEELTAAFNENAADKTTVITESVAAAAGGFRYRCRQFGDGSFRFGGGSFEFGCRGVRFGGDGLSGGGGSGKLGGGCTDGASRRQCQILGGKRGLVDRRCRQYDQHQQLSDGGSADFVAHVGQQRHFCRRHQSLQAGRHGHHITGSIAPDKRRVYFRR